MLLLGASLTLLCSCNKKSSSSGNGGGTCKVGGTKCVRVPTSNANLPTYLK